MTSVSPSVVSAAGHAAGIGELTAIRGMQRVQFQRERERECELARRTNRTVVIFAIPRIPSRMDTDRQTVAIVFPPPSLPPSLFLGRLSLTKRGETPVKLRTGSLRLQGTRL